MKRNNRPGPYDDGEQRWMSEPSSSSVGPQGAALILELQRLRSGVDDSAADDSLRKGRRFARDDGRAPSRQRTGPGKRRKGTIGRAIDVCLVQLGLNAADPVEQRSKPSGHRAAPRRPGATRAPDGPTPMEILSGRATPAQRLARDNGPAPAPPRQRGPARAPDGLTPMDILSGRAPERMERNSGVAPAVAPTSRPSPAAAPDPMDVLSGRAPERFDRNSGVAPAVAPPPRPDHAAAPGARDPMDMLSGRAPERLDPNNGRPAAPPPRRPSPNFASGGPTPMDILSGRAQGDRFSPAPMAPGAARLSLPPPPPSRTELAVQHGDRALVRSDAGNFGRNQVETFRDKMSAGVGFLINRGGLAYVEEPGDSLSVGVGHAFQHELRTGLRVLIAGVVLIGGWAGLVPLAGAVVVPGNLVVQSNVKAIQHPTGGIVAEIPVSNGARVEAGQLLVRLDATQARSSLQVITKQLDEFRVRLARLGAERDGVAQLEFPPEIVARSADPGIKAMLASEQSLFNVREKARESQRDLLQSRVSQLGEQISGLDAQIKSKADQLQLIAGELTGVQDLYDKHLVPLTRLTTLQRESARIDGERGQLLSSIAETKAKIGEAQLQIVKLDQDFRSDVVKDFNEAQAKEAELVEHGVQAKDTLDRIEIRAPTAGVVNQLALHTIGGVIRAGDTVMEIVPDSDDLEIEAHVQPKDIDEVRVGQKAFVAFSALNSRVTPKLIGEVSYVSADASREKDQQAAGPVFTVRVNIPEEERRRLEGARLVSGMPAELFMQTGKHTMLSYLFKPITEQLSRAFVER
jgi:HlyD family secretion protein